MKQKDRKEASQRINTDSTLARGLRMQFASTAFLSHPNRLVHWRWALLAVLWFHFRRGEWVTLPHLAGLESAALLVCHLRIRNK